MAPDSHCTVPTSFVVIFGKSKTRVRKTMASPPRELIWPHSTNHIENLKDVDLDPTPLVCFP
jgi:hypothetical protein